MWETLFWIYLANATLLIVHEIDSAYWQEWHLFRLPGGAAGFVIFHVPLVFLILYGLVLVHDRSPAGLAMSVVLSAGGLFAFVIHTIFLKRGRKEFRAPVSVGVLIATCAVSVFQGSIVLWAMTGGSP